MRDIIKYLSNGGLSKTIYILTMFSASIGCMFLFGYEVINQQPINEYVKLILAVTVLGHGTTIGGGILVNSHGVNTSEQQQQTGKLP